MKTDEATRAGNPVQNGTNPARPILVVDEDGDRDPCVAAFHLRRFQSQWRHSCWEASATLMAPARQVLLLLEHFPAPFVERISVEACFPAAKEVLLAGSFNDWQPAANPLQNQGDGRWIAKLELRHGRYEYRFVVDGHWTDDPMAPLYATNVFGTLNGVLLVS
jgi:hypothetical protein